MNCNLKIRWLEDDGGYSTIEDRAFKSAAERQEFLDIYAPEIQVVDEKPVKPVRFKNKKLTIKTIRSLQRPNGPQWEEGHTELEDHQGNIYFWFSDRIYSEHYQLRLNRQLTVGDVITVSATPRNTYKNGNLYLRNVVIHK